MNNNMTRRKFVVRMVQGSLGIGLGSIAGACGEAPVQISPRNAAGLPAPIPRETKAAQRPIEPPQAFPLLEVSGSPEEIGLAAGKRFEKQIRLGLERRAEWFNGLKAFAQGQGQGAFDKLVSASQTHVPRAFQQLQGWARGTGIPLKDLLVLNLKSEIGLLRDRAEGKSTPASDKERQPGCSTIVVKSGEKLIHVHNEDGADVYADLMFLLKVRPDNQPAYLTLCYPGILPGNAPGFNELGLVQTTNYIAAKEVRLGAGRYFLDHMVLECKTIDEAIEWVTHKERAFAFHHVLTNLKEGRSVGVEVTPAKKETKEIKGLFLHTNHLVYDSMKEAPQDPKYVSSSSQSRWEVLQKWAKTAAPPEGLTRDDLVQALASHEQAPYSPCRHPKGDVHGFTLATAAFETPQIEIHLSVGQPCLGRWNNHSI